MNSIPEIMDIFEYATDSPTKRHIVGGVLLSFSMLFGGLAITIMTIKEVNDVKIDRV